MSTALPLSAVRVLDIGTLIAGPFAATMLGDFGAEIIKVEQPGRGDALRGTPEPDGSIPETHSPNDKGECRKRPPLFKRTFPISDIDDWCGEHPGRAVPRPGATG